MIRILLLSIAFVFCTLFSVQGQAKKEPLKKIGVLKTIDNEGVNIYDHLSLTNEDVLFLNEKGKGDGMRQKKIKWMIVYNRLFLGLHTKNDGNNIQLMEVIAIKNDIILSQYYFEGYNRHYYYIHDLKGKVIIEKIEGGNHRDNYDATKIIEKHFDCREVTDAMYKNVTDKIRPQSTGISAYRCEGAPTIEEVIAGFDATFKVFE